MNVEGRGDALIVGTLLAECRKRRLLPVSPLLKHVTRYAESEKLSHQGLNGVDLDQSPEGGRSNLTQHWSKWAHCRH